MPSPWSSENCDESLIYAVGVQDDIFGREITPA
jgi:hypothetical protein